MTPKNFRHWRKSLGLSQKEAAHALGLKRRVVQYYEKGERDGSSIEIPLYIRLACFALAKGVTDFHGTAETLKVDPNLGDPLEKTHDGAMPASDKADGRGSDGAGQDAAAAVTAKASKADPASGKKAAAGKKSAKAAKTGDAAKAEKPKAAEKGASSSKAGKRAGGPAKADPAADSGTPG